MEATLSHGQSRLVGDALGRLVFHENDTGGCCAENKRDFVHVDNLGVTTIDAVTASQVFR